MSEHTSQQELYKDKCLYTVLNILLSKVQRLEKKVAALDNMNNISISHTKDEIPNKELMNHINKLEFKLNEQTKLLNQHIKNKEQENTAAVLTTELDNYLRDIDVIREFKIGNIPELEQLKGTSDER